MGRDNELGIWGGDGVGDSLPGITWVIQNWGGGGRGSDCSIGVGDQMGGWIRGMFFPVVPYSWPMVEGGGGEGSARK